MGNAMAWDGRPGHDEVWYRTLTDPSTGTIAARKETFPIHHDPDGELVHCYHCGVATMRLSVLDRDASGRGRLLRQTLTCDGRAAFEHTQPEPVAGMPLHL